ncbi:MAG: response regulator [Opitutaceae bacterium]|nr:response regulator [Opitutaceae bacterium]
MNGTEQTSDAHRRILVVDDQQAIHDDFRKMLVRQSAAKDMLDAAAAGLFDGVGLVETRPSFDIDSAYQGQGAVELVCRAVTEGRPYSVAFVDMRMPPGWDGVETIERMWAVDPMIHVVICTAFSDYSWDDLFVRLGESDRLLILKKPFDNVEAMQLATALTEKWRLTRAVRAQVDTLEEKVRRRTAELESTMIELRAAKQAAEVARDQAEAAARAKSTFLANMSHEIRTPMNGVIGMTGLLLDTRLDDEQRDYGETIRKSGEALLCIINDILDFSKIEAGKLELERIEFNPREAAEDVLELMSAAAHRKDLELACWTDDGVPEEILGDPGRFRQILTNLVGNAIKFTEHGEVIVHMSASAPASPQHPRMLRVEITDTGIGLSEEGRARLFQSFSQVDSSTTRRYGGTGLGLAISKQLVELMGGRIGVHSAPGKGSTFWFTIAWTELPRLQPKAGGESVASLLHGRRVLIVDDNATNRHLIVHVLGRWGAQAAEAVDGPSALVTLREAVRDGSPFDAAVLDYHMPGMNGLELAEAIRAQTALAALPLLLLSSALSKEHRASIDRFAIAGAFQKPVRQSTLLRALQKLWSTNLDVTAAEQKAEEQPAGVASVARARVLIVEDNLINQKLTLRMVEKLGHQADVAGSGVEALAALDRTRYDVVLMDCQMPEMDGYEATAQLRRREAATGRHLPVVALTANALTEERQRCLNAGMDDYLSKPVRLENLAAAIARFAHVD